MKETPPKTIGEVGIYLQTMDKRLGNIEKILADQPTRREFDGVVLRIKALEEDSGRNGSKYLTRRDGAVAGGVITFIITVVIFVFNIWDKLKG